MLEPFKFQIQAVMLDRDGDGKIVGERAADPIVLYGVDELQTYAARFEAEVAKVNLATAGTDASPV